MTLRWKEYERIVDLSDDGKTMICTKEKKLQVFRPSPYVGELGKWVDVLTVPSDAPDEE